jgi:GR25 family glycosyltransferase involved in LPS biosynthesis
MKDLSGVSDAFDIVLEVGNLTLSPADRKRLSPVSIWVVRKHFVLSEIETSIFPTLDSGRNLDGIREAWLLRDTTSPDDVTVLETIARTRVRQVPFLWTPLPAEVHHRSFGAEPWKGSKEQKLHIHMVDTNMSSSSSSVIPLVILREAARRKLPIQEWRLHNGEMVAKSRFFKENVLKHCADLDLSGTCVGRQRCVEWTSETNSVALCNLRFNRLRPVLLDLAWVGIPVIHNSPALRDISFGAERFYYTDNSVSEGVAAIERVLADIETGEGWFKNLNARRENILKAWSPMSQPVKSEWSFYIAQLGLKPVVPVPVPVPVAQSPATKSTEFTILFCDMCDSFQADYNFFTLMLNEAGKGMTPPRTVKGVATLPSGTNPDLIVFSVFGDTWKGYPGIPKVHFTGENTSRVEHPDVKLNLSFENVDMVNEAYLRFPLWIMEINWFCANNDRLVNTKTIPLELCTRTSETTLESRKRFCSFIVSNPRNAVRNNAFHTLSQYKPVDSGGRLFNNIGNELAAGLGGGGGELIKTKFMMNYKFAIAYENESNNGYCTEKYLHAKAAGTVPIYWGDPDFERDFDPAGCIDARNFRTPEELIAAVREVDTDDSLWAAKAAVPALDAYRVDLTRRAISEAARRIFAILGLEPEVLGTIPRFLGAAPGTPEAKFGMEFFQAPAPRAAEVPRATPDLQVPLVVTYATFNFLGSLQQWLITAKTQLRAFPNFRALVFLGLDVTPETVAALREKHTFADFEYIPDWTPPNFPDFWEPSNYGWKLWLYHTLVHRESLAGKLILYMDAGSVLVRFNVPWLTRASQEGICCLEDPREENDRWCGDLFCERIQVTEQERAAKQIVAGLLCFVSGHPLAITFFDEAFTLAQDRDVLVGPRLSGVGADGKSYGHRQDQSILSILVRRHPIPLLPLDSVYCDHSMRRTFQSGKSIYVHRGNFIKALPFLPGIEDAFVINLDRRTDRMEKFWKNHPELTDRVNRYSAFDGKQLTLTPELAQLFGPNDFFWKKAVMGCALSHLGLWWKLANEHPDITNYLIFEDDAKLAPGWEDTLAKSMAHAPEDYDVLYLGGILPPNRASFEGLLTPVSKYYSCIQPHQFFGQKEPTPYFHSCAYAYILSRRGAIKILESITARKGYWTSADHMMCSPCETMKLYFLTPMVAGCFQDDDPAYANSDFNNFSRVDSFDSDLWNNDERFGKEVIERMNSQNGTTVFNTAKLLTAVYNPVPVANAKPAMELQTLSNSGTALPQFVCIKGHAVDFSKFYEADWLMGLLDIQSVTVQEVDPQTTITGCPIMILQRPHTEAATALLEIWNERGWKFKILHLSDEHPSGNADSLRSYSLPGCVGVLRNYIRSDLPPGTESKVSVIPLGYHWSPVRLTQEPLIRTPKTPFREIHWSFYGTGWNGRSEQMKALVDAKLINRHAFYDNWNDPVQLSKDDYLSVLLNSVFVPCPDGVNPETYRFYEALEAGCIPIVLKSEQNEAWFRWVSDYIPLVDIITWEDAIRVMMTLLTKPATLEIYREKILQGWSLWLKEVKAQAQQWMKA